MKRFMKVLSCLVLTAVLMAGMVMPAFAADSSVTYYGKNAGFGFAPGSGFSATDLFDGFKGVMPGDELTEQVSITNMSKETDYIKVYLKAVPHDETENPMSSEVAEVEESVASMNDFLSRLHLTVKQGETVIFDGAPNEAEELEKGVYLGKLRRNRTLKLDATLLVPIDMGNDYANRAGEVDWIITVECFNDPPLFQTGQLNWPIPVLGGLGLLLILAGVLMMRRKRKDQYA